MKTTLFIFLMLCCSVFGADVTFDGAVDNDWNDAGNWDNTGTDRIPIAGDDAIIPNTFTVVLDTPTVACDSITNSGTGNITLDLDVIADTTISANLVSVAADLLTVSGVGTVTITGNVTGSASAAVDCIQINTGASVVTLVINGDVTAGSNTSSNAINNGDANTTITISGSLTGDGGYGIASFVAGGTFTFGTLVYTNGKLIPFANNGTSITVTTGFSVNGTLYTIGGGSTFIRDSTGGTYRYD